MVVVEGWQLGRGGSYIGGNGAPVSAGSLLRHAELPTTVLELHETPHPGVQGLLLASGG